MLNFTVQDTGKILETNNVKVIRRHCSPLESIIDKTHQLKLQVQELLIENHADIRSWSENLEAQIHKSEGALKQVKHVATDIRLGEEGKHVGKRNISFTFFGKD